MSATFSPDDMLDAYLRGKHAALDSPPVYDQEDDEPLTFDAVVHTFRQSSPSDVLRLDDAKPAELIRVFLDAIESRQYVYRTTRADGWMMHTLTTHGAVVVNMDSKGTMKFHVPSPPIGSGTLSMREQILKAQVKYREDDKGWNLETGEQFGRWY